MVNGPSGLIGLPAYFGSTDPTDCAAVIFQYPQEQSQYPLSTIVCAVGADGVLDCSFGDATSTALSDSEDYWVLQPLNSGCGTALNLVIVPQSS